MPETFDSYEMLEARLAAWAAGQPAIRAILSIGSRARGTPDRWSDLDVLIFAIAPQPYVDDPAWLNELGDLWLTYREDTGAGDPEWYALFAGGFKLDAVLLRVEEPSQSLDEILQAYAHWHAIQLGVDVLFDRLGTRRKIPPVPFTPENPPSVGEFTNTTNGALLASATVAKFVARGDYWRAQHWFAHDLRPHLLTLMRWQAFGKNTWYGGRFMEEWADPRTLAALPHVFPSVERNSLQKSLLDMLDLFKLLGEETAAKFGYVYPAEAHENIRRLVENIFYEPLSPL
jgi:aminoglycoside 6-adenylyltransferase